MLLAERLRDRMGFALAAWIFVGAAAEMGLVLWVTGTPLEIDASFVAWGTLPGALLGMAVGFYAEFGKSRVARVLRFVGFPAWLASWAN